MATYPENGEFVIATISKIMPYGAFCTLDEYASLEAFLHISEVSSGWVKNIRDFVKEGQKVVAVITRVDLEKRQIDLSLKRIGESDKRRKMESYQLSKRAAKLLERAALKMKKTVSQAYIEAGNPLIAEFGDLYSAFKGIKEGVVQTKLSPAWLEALQQIADQEIRQKEIRARVKITLISYDSSGVDKIKDALQKALKIAEPATFHYVGAPHYQVDLVRKEHKEIDKIITGMERVLSSISGIEFSLEREENAA